MRKTILFLAFTTTVSGCATFNQQALDANHIESIKGKTVTTTSRQKPDFAAMTAGKAMFALLGAAAMISEGNGIIASNNVADPANTIAAGLTKELENRYGVHVVTPPALVSNDDTDSIATSVNTTARFVIDAQTVNWSFGYFPTDWDHYRVMYTAKARLIDVQNKTVVAEGFCKHIPDSNVNAPTYDELLANNAALLKSELSTVADECIKSMTTQMLTL